jgi:hypothetical protein
MLPRETPCIGPGADVSQDDAKFYSAKNTTPYKGFISENSF